jgi:excisionase family DNA binding protein
MATKTPETLQPPVEPMALSVEESCRASGVGRSTLYNAIKMHELRVLKVGDRTLIEPDELRRWLASKRQ